MNWFHLFPLAFSLLPSFQAVSSGTSPLLPPPEREGGEGRGGGGGGGGEGYRKVKKVFGADMVIERKCWAMELVVVV